MFFIHFYKAVAYYLGELKTAIEGLGLPWKKILGAMMLLVAGPAAPLLLMLYLGKKIYENFGRIRDVAGQIGGAIGKVGGLVGLANGGMVNPIYAAQGAGVSSTSMPYVVGERGPELFMPRQAGRIIPNKDLNTQRVKNMLQDAFNLAPRAGAAGVSHTNTLVVSSLNVGSADIKKTKLGVDVFG
jgi:hypothetical protein